MNLDLFLQEGISEALTNLYQISADPHTISIQPTRKEFEGTHTFVTFPYARAAKTGPQQIAQSLGQYLKERFPEITQVQVVKGFLNISLSDKVWLEKIQNIISHDEWGTLSPHGSVAVVEFSSPNTNKPLHLGHLRNIFLGFSVSKIMKAAGFRVSKVCIVNDRGIHICKSMVAYNRFGNGTTPESEKMKGDHFVGRYYVLYNQQYQDEVARMIEEGYSKPEAEQQAPILLEAQGLLKKWEQNDPVVRKLWQQMNQWVYDGFDQTYRRLGVAFDKIYYESNTYVLGKDLVKQGLEKEVFYRKDDGSVWVNLEDIGLDEKLILRKDGTAVYMTQDLGTADLRHQDYNFDRSVYVVGNEQDYHFKVLFEILRRLGKSYSKGLYHLSYGMVDLPSGKMKSREGTVVDADQIIAEMIATAEQHTRELGKIEGLTEKEAEALYQTLGLGALKYFLTKVDPQKRMLFNPQESISFQGDTGPFIQYTHARISAILRKAVEASIPEEFDHESIKQLEECERMLIYWLNEYPRKIQLSAEEYSPAVIAQYVYDLAKEYNRFYAEVSIFNATDPNLVSLRVMLSAQTARTIKLAMDLLGIRVPERM